jgi:tRNA-specific 2-thiouridylase
VDFRKDFAQNVYEDFIQTYERGRTPNPCVVCNRTIKFGKLVEFADSFDIYHIATGHYVKCDGNFFYEGLDKGKDQSYFLAQVDKNVLPRVIFPLQDYLKEQVRELAKGFEGLQIIASQKESSEICFVEDTYMEVLRKHMDTELPGVVVDQQGREVGEHKGYMHYTIGKRRGFTVHGAHEPHYVTHIDAKSNRITVGKKDALQTDEVFVKECNWFGDIPETCEVKVRYRTPKVPCTIQPHGDGIRVRLHESAYGVAKGQIAAFYEGQKLLGGGVIA